MEPKLDNTANLEQGVPLPDGWHWVPLPDVCLINPSTQKPKGFADTAKISFVPMAAVDDFTGTISNPGIKSLSEVWKGYKRFQTEDVIFARITPCMENGKAAIARNLSNGLACGSTEFHILRALPDKVIPEWLYYFVRQKSFRDQAATNFTGTAGQLRVPAAFLEQQMISVPSIAEQQKIVSKIEALLQQARTAHNALSRIPSLLKAFRQSILAAAFRGDLTKRDPNDEPAESLLERIRVERRRKWEEDMSVRGKDPARMVYEEPAMVDAERMPQLPDGWMWVCFEELLEELKNGRFSQTPKVDPGGTPILRISAVRPLSVNLTDIRYLDEDERLHSEYFLKENDLLFTRYNGSLDLVGVCGLVKHLPMPTIYPDKLIRARLHSPLLPKFIELYFASSLPRQIIENKAKSSAGQTGISGKDLKSVPVVLPPVGEQFRIVDKVRRLIENADFIAQSGFAASENLEKLEQQILIKAFQGKL